ncbi:MAG: hypothetical protein AAFP84_03695 [Actinomycetota bacterium]
MPGRRSGYQAAGAVLAAALGVTACSGGGDDEDATTTTVADESTASSTTVTDRPTTTLPACAADDPITLTGWPVDVTELFDPIAASFDDFVYEANGVTNDPEALLVRAFDGIFADSDATEPEGDATTILVDFIDARGVSTLVLVDGDQDDCWDVTLRTTLEERPLDEVTIGDAAGRPIDGDTDGGSTGDPGSGDGSGDPDGGSDGTTNDGGAGGGGADGAGAPGATVADVGPPPPDPLDDLGVGRAEVITGRGTFTLAVFACSTGPLDVRGESADGSLTVTGVAPDDVTLTWTHADGVVITDPQTDVLALTELGGTLVADGENPDGPETIFAEFDCESS